MFFVNIFNPNPTFTSVTVGANLTIDSDSGKLYFGADQDAYIYDDGTDLIIDADILLSGSKELRLNPNGGDIHLFDVKLLGGSTDGYKLYLHNMSEAASNAGSIYIDSFGRLHLDSPNDDIIFSAAGSVQFESIGFADDTMYTTGYRIKLEANRNGTDQGEIDFYLTTNTFIQIRGNEDVPSYTADFNQYNIICNNLTIGNAAAGVDYTLTFDGETSNGVLTWMEDEDRFQFADAVLLDLTLGVTGLSTLTGGISLPAGANIALATTTGSRIGTSTSQLLGFYNATPVDQPATVADAATQDLTGLNTVDQTKLEADLTSVKNTVNTVIDRLQELGLIA